MSTMIIPAKKEFGPDTDLKDIKNIWDYVDMYVEEDNSDMFENNFSSFLDDGDGFDDDFYDCDDSWDSPYREDYDWESDYRDAFEDEPEAYWGREG